MSVVLCSAFFIYIQQQGGIFVFTLYVNGFQMGFLSLGECSRFSHHHDCSFCIWAGVSTGDVSPTNIAAIPTG